MLPNARPLQAPASRATAIAGACACARRGHFSSESRAAVACHHAARVVAFFADTPAPAAVGIAGLTLTALLLIGARVHADVVAMVLCVSFASYAIDRVVDRTREAGHFRGQTALIASSLGMFCASVVIALLRAGPWLAACAAVFPITVLGYCVPWLWRFAALERRGIRRIKDIPYAKNLYTAFCIALSAVWAGAISGAVDVTRLILAAAVVFMMMLINTAACDLGDVEDDIRNGVPTLGVKFGREKTARMLLALAYAWAALLVGLTAAGAFPPCAIVGAATVLPTDAYLRRLTRGGDVKLFADVVPDLAVAFTGVVMLVAHLAAGG